MSNNRHNIEIIEFSAELSEPIKTLNYEWLEKYFRVEEGDIISLSDPQKYIIDNGGYLLRNIFYLEQISHARMTSAYNRHCL